MINQAATGRTSCRRPERIVDAVHSSWRSTDPVRVLPYSYPRCRTELGYVKVRMTLIAAFEAGGFPVLISDVVLSAPFATAGLWLPSVGDVDNAMKRYDTTKRDLRPVSGCRKFAFLGSNCALAWAGPVTEAEQLCAEYDELAATDRGPSLNAVLALVEEPRLRQRYPGLGLVFVGVEDGQATYGGRGHAYCYSSRHHGRVWAAGTGTGELLQYLNERVLLHRDGAVLRSPQKAIVEVLATLYANDALTGTVFSRQFGGAFDAAIATTAGVQHAPSYDIIFADVSPAEEPPWVDLAFGAITSVGRVGCNLVVQTVSPMKNHRNVYLFRRLTDEPPSRNQLKFIKREDRFLGEESVIVATIAGQRQLSMVTFVSSARRNEDYPDLFRLSGTPAKFELLVSREFGPALGRAIDAITRES